MSILMRFDLLRTICSLGIYIYMYYVFDREGKEGEKKKEKKKAIYL